MKKIHRKHPYRFKPKPMCNGLTVAQREQRIRELRRRLTEVKDEHLLREMREELAELMAAHQQAQQF